MKFARMLFVAVLTVALTAGLGLAATAPASAVPGDASVSSVKSKPAHNVVWKTRGKTGDDFYSRGRVSTYRMKNLSLQSTPRGKGNWSTVKSTRTTDKGRWGFRFNGVIGRCYRIKIPATRRNALTFVRVGCIVKA